MKLVGIDEAGRGPWAGPLTAAAVIINGDVTGLDDSKVLDSSSRAGLFDQIIQVSQVGIGWSPTDEIDELGLTEATARCMERAVRQLPDNYNKIMIDGHINYLRHISGSEALIKADAKVKEVSAASIIAKVARDRYMQLLATAYPRYGFGTNFGYGTKDHQEALRKYGQCHHHRTSFEPIKQLKNLSFNVD